MEEDKNPQKDVSQEVLDQVEKRRLLEERRAAYYEERTRQLEEATKQMEEAAKQNEQSLKEADQNLKEGKVPDAQDKIQMMLRCQQEKMRSRAA